jgi:hypothetical protein
LLQTLGLNHQRALWVFRCLQVCLFDDHFYSYEVRQTSKITLISCNSLMQDDCSCIRKVADRLLVTERIPLVHHIPGLASLLYILSYRNAAVCIVTSTLCVYYSRLNKHGLKANCIFYIMYIFSIFSRISTHLYLIRS